MRVLISWTVYGAWFAGPGRGRIDQGRPGWHAVPEPEAALAAERRADLAWPPAQLGERERVVVVEDLVRIAALRDFTLEATVAAPDHVHVLLSCGEDRDLERLVQLAKGATSRALTVAAGDAAPRDRRGHEVRYHRWWSHQHSSIVVEEGEREGVVAALRGCAAQPGRTTRGVAS